MLTHEAHPALVAQSEADSSTLEADSNAAPASIEAVSVLADDTIMADGLQLDPARPPRPGVPGANTVAVFANPYSGVEEVLYIDSEWSPRWLHNVQGKDSSAGWSSTPLDPQMQAAHVVVTCDADNGVDAWISRTSTSGANRNGILERWRLTRAPDGTVSWVRVSTPIDHPGDGVPVRLFVQYQGRPSTPVVFAVQNELMLWVYLSSWSAQGVASWESVRTTGVALFDGPTPEFQVSGGFAVPKLAQKPSDITEVTRFWIGRGLELMRDTIKMDGSSHEAKQISIGTEQFVGLMTTPDGVGCFFSGGLYGTLTASSPLSSSWDQNLDYDLGVGLRDLTAWCDADGRHHIHGVDKDNTLQVFHQTGWQTVTHGDTDFTYPTFENTGSRLVARSVFPDVKWATIDRYPDATPSLQVTHTSEVSNGGVTETCALYTQQYNSSDWSTEIVRLERKALRKVTRYQTTLTVKNSFGGPIPDYNVEITTDEPMDLEVNGRSVRPGPDKPVSVPTDFRGKVSIRTVAHGLYTPNVHVTTPTMLKGITFNQSADVQKFVAGVGTLQSRPEGFTADAVKGAKTPDGRWVFPNLVRPPGESVAEATAAQLTPQEFVSKCAQVFALSKGVTLDPVTVEGTDEPQAIYAVATQTWDPTRPAYQVFTTAEELEAHRIAIEASPSYVGMLDPIYPWFGDIMQGIENGVVSVIDAVFGVGHKVATITVALADGATQSFTLVLDAVERAVQYVMSIWSLVQATFYDFAEWVKWAFDFEDVLKTKDALVSGATQAAELLPYLCEQILDTISQGWFAAKAKEIETLLPQIQELVDSPTFGMDQPLPPRSSEGDGPAYGTPERLLPLLDNPHVTWSLDQIAGPDAGILPSMPPLKDLSPDLKACVDEVLEAWKNFYDTLVEVAGEQGQKFLDDLAKFFLSFLDLADPQTFVKNIVSAIYQFKDDIVETVLKAADALVALVSSLVKAAAKCMTGLLGLPYAIAGPGSDNSFAWMWNFVGRETGVEADAVTYGDVVGLAIAYPLTVAYKALTGEVPFPNGAPTIPLPVKPGAPAGEPPEMPSYPVPSNGQIPVQALCGLATCILQGYADQYANSRKESESTSILIGIGQVLTFLWMDIPIFWGSQNWWKIPSDSVERYWYAEYMTKSPIYAIDGILCMIGPFIPVTDPDNPTKKFLGRKILVMLENIFGNLCITYGAILEGAFSITLYVQAEPGNVMAGTWLWSQLLGLSSSVTAVQREVFVAFPDYILQKRVYDFVGDVSAGMWWFTMALSQLPLQGALIDTIKKPPPVVKPGAKVTYEFGTIYPPAYGDWNWWLVAPEDEKENLAGLEFKSPPGNSSSAVLTGTIAEEGTYTFTVAATNQYDPARELETLPLTLEVKA